MDLAEIVTKLRTEGSDTNAVEVKLAAGGVPQDIAPTLCAFANRPGGGTLIFGLREGDGFRAEGVYDAKEAQQAVAKSARNALQPPVSVESEAVEFEGKTLVVFRVEEADQAVKPVRVRHGGKAYLRLYDGNFQMSSLEEQAFIGSRGEESFDTRPVLGATVSDLSELGVLEFVAARKAQSSAFESWDRDEVLVQTDVVSKEGVPTVAGLLALGVYPQRFFPNVAVEASLWSGREKHSDLLDHAVLEGPIPVMLDDAVRWVVRNTSSAVVEGQNGGVFDRPEYPVRAVRELVANALIHRDLSSYGLSTYVTLALEPGRLRISNPGGLYGLSVTSLGRTDSHLRNGRLANILLNLRSPSGERVIERLGSGIPKALDALASAGMAPPTFFDTGLGFTAMVRSGHVGTASTPRPATRDSERERSADILDALAAGPLTVSQLVSLTGYSDRQVRYTVHALRAEGLVEPTDSSKRNVMLRLS